MAGRGGVAGRGNGFLWGKRGLGLKVVHELPGISREEGGWADIKNLGPVKLVVRVLPGSQVLAHR